MLGPGAMLGAAAEEAAGGGPGPGPTGPPTMASIYNAGDEMNTETGVQWTNGDPTATTGIGKSISSSVDPTSNFGSVAAGVTSFETGENADTDFWYVRHQKNMQDTVWVLAGAGIGA